jgi:hypothetical protein
MSGGGAIELGEEVGMRGMLGLVVAVVMIVVLIIIMRAGILAKLGLRPFLLPLFTQQRRKGAFSEVSLPHP